jgi:glycosyltransferase involved in cell wall biosynthesis
MRIAWFTPLNRKSAIGQFSAQVLEELATLHEVVAYASDVTSLIDCWPLRCPARLVCSPEKGRLLGELKPFDAVIYNLGNHLHYHQSIYETLLCHPGIVILHDLVMHHFFAGYYLHHVHDTDGYVRHMAYGHGRQGEELAKLILAGRRPRVWEEPEALTYHLARPAVRRSYGIVVHSEYAKRELESFATAPIKKIPFPEPRISSSFFQRPLARTVGAKERIKLLTFGTFHPNKMLDFVVETIGRNSFLRSHVDYTVIGTTSLREYRNRVESLVREYGLGNCVHLAGHQPDDALVSALRKTDIVINLRNPHAGESSWSLLEALYAGKPSIVWRHGYYDEHPEDVDVKIASKDELAPALSELCSGHEARLRRAQACWDYARNTFTTKKYCSELLDFIESSRVNKPVLDLADSLCDKLLEMRADSSSVGLIDTLEHEICQLARIGYDAVGTNVQTEPSHAVGGNHRHA